jgi:chemotaxis protein CheD
MITRGCGPPRAHHSGRMEGGLNDPNAVLTTILGSCVAACLRDPVAGVGGMNHFLLPGNATDADDGGRCDALRRASHGTADQRPPEAGRASRPAGGQDLRRSEDDLDILQCRGTERRFCHAVPEDEGIPVVGSSTGGDHGRKLEFWPVSGRARQYPLTGAETQKPLRLNSVPWRRRSRSKPASNSSEPRFQ